MSALSPIPIILVLILALATTHVLARRLAVVVPGGRVSSIDGLRGFLALSVFINHGAVWFFYLRTGVWHADSRLYNHLGESAVALFFMITGFLFFSKLINAKKRPVDWTRLYIGRLLRLGPLYLFAMAVLFTIVAILSEGRLKESAALFALDAARWLGFTVAGIPDLNGISRTWIIIGGVTWTLRYEWIFYLLLPLLGWAVSSRPPAGYLLLGGLALLSVKLLDLHPSIMAAFLGGMAAAVLVRCDKVRAIASARLSALLVAGCVAAVVTQFPTAFRPVPLLLLSVAFILVAGGNTVFGLLTHATARVLGELTYSIYLLHGLLLFGVFHFGLGLANAAALSPTGHWLVIALCTPLLIGLSFLTFLRIESPAMRLAPKVVDWLRSGRFLEAHPSPKPEGHE